jgi:hypothetical protein
MSTEFTAKFIHAESEGETRTVGLADDQFETRRYVLFQRTLNPSNRDRQLGQDQLHVTIDDQSRSTYGGVERLLLKINVLTVQLNREAAAALKTEQDIVIQIAPGAGDVNQLAAALREVAPASFEDGRS